MRRRLTLLICFLSTLLGISALIVSTSGGKAVDATVPTVPPSALVVAEADEYLPGQTPENWRVFSDEIVLVRVVAEHRISASDEEEKNGEGFMGRLLDFVVVDRLWNRDGAPSAPDSFSLSVDVWTFTKGETTPLRFQGEPMMLVGSLYVIPMVYLTRGHLVDEPEWSNLSIDALIPVSNNVLGEGDELVGGESARSTIERLLWGRPVSAVASLMDSTPLPKYAMDYMQLAPTDRLTMISREKADPDGAVGS